MKSFTLTMVVIALLVIGCTPEPPPGEGFSLPVGDVQRGQQTFLQLNCHACHTVAGIEFEPAKSPEPPMIALGGVTPRIKTYGDLVTSIINPSHRFALGYSESTLKQDEESRMRIYNDEMTVTQLIDLVTFLQAHYEVRAYQPTPYMPFY